MTPNTGIQEDISLNYLKQALTHYQNLVPNFTSIEIYNEGGYWVLGCILDSMIDYLNLAGSAGLVPYEAGRQFLNKTAIFYLSNKEHGVWYDDWAWWANATAKIFDPNYSNLFSSDSALNINFNRICKQTFDFVINGQNPFQDLSCFVGTKKAYSFVKQMAQSSPGQGWETLSTQVEPLFDHGCWQAPMAPQGSYDPSGSYDPRIQSLGPFQDSVINELFYMLVQRTLNQQGFSVQSDVDEMTDFYNNWINSPSLSQENKLYTFVVPGEGLFRERISIYKNKQPVNGYNPNLIWTGDQGLMLMALTPLYYKQTGLQQQATLSLIISTIKGVFNYAVGDMSDQYKNIIMPWCNLGQPINQQPGFPPGGDYGDYFSGTGVFMRGLLEASSIPAVKQLMSSLPMQVKLNISVNAITAKDDQYMNFVLAGNPPDDAHVLFDDFNKMATLLVASQFLKGESE